MTIGNNIKKLRTAQGLTQEQLAERLFVTRQTISSWERSASHPSLEQLEAIAAALGEDVMTLLYGPKAQVPAQPEAGHSGGCAPRVGCYSAGAWGCGTAPSRGLGHAAKTGVAVLCDCISADRGSVAGLWHRGIGLSELAAGLKREGKAAVFDYSAGVSAGQPGPFCLDSSGALPLPHLCVLDVQL